MRVLLVYESMFGNTALIAQAVADGMSGRVHVRVADAATMPEVAGMDAVVVGAPTHAFGLSRPSTRLGAAERGAPAPPDRPGTREWLAALPHAALPAAVFDTVFAKPILLGSAAGKAARLLRRAGYRLIVPPESFWVTDTAGPLRAGELDRARRWGEQIAAAVAAPQHTG
ncbi:flavodoxin domain-containing protein [Spirilliplanes yamanashiensis]|uniref:Flavodoxin-like domain-containing protein n=1 Tax=Spirilliplanes yamanashiensis TaxID=42233 RepID=A0A8J3YFA3_9ACTN|nr:flavodoxin domain-containing protein [Spirilliplanes yamanashiensis]MDP9818279.1 hypothetical protein [Spirilliplanes yamanashiensis]GIJ06697.1 hypothetical protein Sya03_60490 [Spirilliplanes yamanashiensis]